MSNYRQNGDVSDLRTTKPPWTLASLVGIGLLLAFVLSLWAHAMNTDFEDADKAERLFKAERALRAVPTLPANLAEAYEQGRAEAMESLLAQACPVEVAR